MNIGLWVLVFPIGSMICATITVWMSIWNQRYRKLARMQHIELRELMSVVDCLWDRGKIACDICSEPIAPKTPTVFEEHEPHVWTLAHKRCIDMLGKMT